MAKRKIKKKLSPLKLISIAVLGVGGGYLLWSKLIKPRFFSGDFAGTNDGDLIYSSDDLAKLEIGSSDSGSSGGGGGTSGGGGGGSSQAKNANQGIELDKKIRKGDKGDLVYRVQIAINKIAGLRGKSSYKDKDKGKTINFPISLDKDFGNQTDSGAKFAFPSYKGSGYITLRKAREQWVRSAGYFKKPFPVELSAVSNYSDLKKIYDINYAKQKGADESIWTKDLGYGFTIF